MAQAKYQAKGPIAKAIVSAKANVVASAMKYKLSKKVTKDLVLAAVRSVK